eukprot:2221195-Pleurochrysis_carterae.AAC.1
MANIGPQGMYELYCNNVSPWDTKGCHPGSTKASTKVSGGFCNGISMSVHPDDLELCRKRNPASRRNAVLQGADAPG